MECTESAEMTAVKNSFENAPIITSNEMSINVNATEIIDTESHASTIIDLPENSSTTTNVELTKSIIDCCQCSAKLCSCKSELMLTKGVVDYLIKYYNLDSIEESITKGLRKNAIHVYGVHNLSTKDLINLWPNFNYKIEWINDDACNLVLNSIESVFQFLATQTEEYSFDEDLNVQSENIMMSRDIWRKVNKLPENSDDLFMRFATINDVKVARAEQSSKYYIEHGNPNYDNMKGLISKSRRERLKRKVVLSENDDQSVDNRLVSYDDLPVSDDDESPVEIDDPNLDRESDNESKKRKMIVSMRLYSDGIADKDSRRRPGGNSAKRSVYSRLG